MHRAASATAELLVLFAFHSNYGPILYHYGDKAINWWKIAILGKRYYGTLRSPYVVAIPSVCCRLSVTFVTSCSLLKLFDSISAAAISLGLDSLC